MGRGEPRIFDVVPEGLFGPLASANRRHYWRLLMQLFDEFFGPDAPLPPSHGYPRRELTAAIERYLLGDDPWESDDGIAPDTPLGVRANLIYERFRASGWLRQERIGAREMVSMPPIVAHLLNTLVDFIERGPAFIGAKVRAIELMLRQVVEGVDGGDTLDEAAQLSRQLLSHVSAIGVQVRDLMPQLSRTESTAMFVRELFQRYVSELFIGDYADLHKLDHPLSRRAAILGMARDLASGPRYLQLRAWYAEHLFAGDEERAAERLHRSLQRLQELDRIDEYLARLDEDIRHANRRALAFLDYRLRTPDSVQALLEGAIAGALVAPADALRFPVASGALLSEERLRPPRRKPLAIARNANAVLQPTPEQIARMRLLRQIKRARLVLPEDLQHYLQPFHHGGSVQSEKLPVSTIAEIRAYQTLLTIALRSHRKGGLRSHDPLQRHLRGFTVQLQPDANARDGALRTQAFVVTFRKPARTAA